MDLKALVQRLNLVCFRSLETIAQRLLTCRVLDEEILKDTQK